MFDTGYYSTGYHATGYYMRIDIVGVNLGDKRTQDFTDNQRTQVLNSLNRTAGIEETNKRTKFAESARLLTKSNVNRETKSTSSKGKTKLTSKNRTLN